MRVLACVLVEDHGTIALGSVKRRCSLCRREVWVAPSGFQLIAKHGLAIVCLPCAAKAEPGAVIQAPTPEQLAEGMATILHYRRRN